MTLTKSYFSVIRHSEIIMDDTLIADDKTTFINNNQSQPPARTPINNSVLISSALLTPQQNGKSNQEINTQTVTKKPRTRQQTVTVENQSSKEVEAVFARVLSIPALENPIEELKRQIQKLFIQKEGEWAYKLNETKQTSNEDSEICRLKLKSAMVSLSQMEEFTKHLNTTAPNLIRQTSPNGSIAQNGEINGQREVTTPQITGRTFSPDLLNDILKERDSLREEYSQLENSYSDLFKRYEKMRENCVLLKNSEEELKTMQEEEAAKYEKLLARYHELRESAAEQLNRANVEIQKISKQHEENTLGLRCRLKINETQVQTLNLTIQGKDAQIVELNNMCKELMEKTGLMDDGEEMDDDEYE